MLCSSVLSCSTLRLELSDDYLSRTDRLVEESSATRAEANVAHTDLSTQIAKLEANRSTTCNNRIHTSGVDRTSPNLERLESSVDHIKQRVDGLSDQLAEIDKHVHELSESVAGVIAQKPCARCISGDVPPAHIDNTCSPIVQVNGSSAVTVQTMVDVRNILIRDLTPEVIGNYPELADASLKIFLMVDQATDPEKRSCAQWTFELGELVCKLNTFLKGKNGNVATKNAGRIAFCTDPPRPKAGASAQEIVHDTTLLWARRPPGCWSWTTLVSNLSSVLALGGSFVTQPLLWFIGFLKRRKLTTRQVPYKVTWPTWVWALTVAVCVYLSFQTAWTTTLGACWSTLAIGVVLTATAAVMRHEWHLQRPLYELSDYEKQIANWERMLDEVKALFDPPRDQRLRRPSMSSSTLRTVLNDTGRAIDHIGTSAIPAAGYPGAEPIRLTLRLRILVCKAATEAYLRQIDTETGTPSPEETV